MGVMGLGENGLNVHGRLDVAISPPPFPNRIIGGMEDVGQDSKPKKLSCCICQAIIKFHNVTMPSFIMDDHCGCVIS